MATERWDSVSVKSQLRLTTQRLGQSQERQDSQGAITRRDIATLLQQRNVSLARAKAQSLQREDALGDLLEVIEMHVGQLLEHFNELDQGTHLTPVVVEAASTIIYTAPHVGLKDLEIVGSLLAQHLGPHFAHSAVNNQDGHVAPIAIRTLTALPPSARDLDVALQKVASDYGVDWTPEPLRQDILKPVSEILDPQASPVVDLPALRRLCHRGIPDEPKWLRPRIWKYVHVGSKIHSIDSNLRLFFGTLPVAKAAWAQDIQSQRDSYYDLTRRLLDPFANLSPPTGSTLDSLDATLLAVSDQLSAIPSDLFGDLGQPPDSSSSGPLDDDAKDEIKLTCAKNLDTRLDILRARESKLNSTAPKAEPDSISAPEISLSSPDVDQSSGVDGITTTLLSFKPLSASIVHPKHLSALLRLLYLHASVNPGHISPHIPSLLVPVYAVLNHEVSPEDLAHVEADTFWLFEALVGEFSDLDDEEGGSVWMKRFSERLAWADPDLFNGLQAKGLDPALPHYSYRWLAPILTHTLPLRSVLPVWDAVFSCPARTRDTNPKIDHLLDICTTMLMRARVTLLKLGKNGRKSPSLWSEENIAFRPPSPLHAWKLGDAFAEGVAFLKDYPVEAAGGVDRILQGAIDLGYRRNEGDKATQKDSMTLGARIKATMWKGFTNQESSPDSSESEDDSSDGLSVEDGNDTETPSNPVSGLTSRLANTVWKGITNQTSMEPPPSPKPSSPSTPVLPTALTSPDVAQPHQEGNLTTTSSLWAYADKLKDSDTVAAIAKASSNWRARSILGSWGRTAPAADEKPFWSPQLNPLREEKVAENEEIGRRGSLPITDRNGDLYSPPPRPQYFRPPRDSFILTDQTTLSPKEEPQYEDKIMDKARSLQSTFATLTRSSSSATAVKSGPRPLLLSPTSLTSPPSRPVSRSAGNSPAPDRQWADVMRLKQSPHRDSMSSISSLSPSIALRSSKSSHSDWESDTGSASRRVPINRKSLSPMAPGFRAARMRTPSGSLTSSPEPGVLSPPLLLDRNDLQKAIVEKLDSPSATVNHSSSTSSIIHELNGNGVELTDPGVSAIDTSPDMPNKKLPKITPPLLQAEDASDSSVGQVPSRSPRLRSKRYAPRPLDLNTTPHPRPEPERKLSNPNNLAVEWPSDDYDTATTPKASTFAGDDSYTSVSPNSFRSPRRSRKASADSQERLRKTSSDYHESRPRKVSTGQRSRKISNDQKQVTKRRESSADEGDDEGYDDLLSAYESEGSQVSDSVR
ncbi:hypothetical protein H0H92_013425 [Tricholoma furcatifolium]|nr:hypothetical protein H0H92_013425 [Tricholoma furcatifolium]